MSEDYEKSFEFKIVRFENSKAYLSDENIEIIIPKKMIPKTLSEGENIHITFSSSEVQDTIKQEGAKKILNEILKSG